MNNQISKYYRRYSSYLSAVIADPIIRSYFSLVASLFLVAFLLVFALSPTINTILGLQKKITDQEEILSRLDSKISSLVAAGEAYNGLRTYLPLLDAALPDRPEPQVVVEDVSRTASSSAVVVTSLQFKNVNLTDDFPIDKEIIAKTPEVGFLVSLTGSESQIKTFLGEMENKRRYIRITSVSLVGKEEGVIMADAIGVGYYFRQQ